MELIPVGHHQAKVVDYGLDETKKGLPQVFIQFHIAELSRNITWYGGVSSDGALDVTGKTLIRCGFKNTDLSLLADGKNGGHLNTEKTLQLEIEHNTWEGKTYSRVKWVNEMGGPQNKLDRAGAVQKLAGFNIPGKLIQLQQEMGIKNEPATNNPAPTEQYQTGKHDKAPF